MPVYRDQNGLRYHTPAAPAIRQHPKLETKPGSLAVALH